MRNILEVEKGKDLCTYADIVYSWRTTDQLSNREEGTKCKKFERN